MNSIRPVIENHCQDPHASRKAMLHALQSSGWLGADPNLRPFVNRAPRSDEIVLQRSISDAFHILLPNLHTAITTYLNEEHYTETNTFESIDKDNVIITPVNPNELPKWFIFWRAVESELQRERKSKKLGNSHLSGNGVGRALVNYSDIDTILDAPTHGLVHTCVYRSEVRAAIRRSMSCSSVQSDCSGHSIPMSHNTLNTALDLERFINSNNRNHSRNDNHHSTNNSAPAPSASSQAFSNLFNHDNAISPPSSNSIDVDEPLYTMQAHISEIDIASIVSAGKLTPRSDIFEQYNFWNRLCQTVEQECEHQHARKHPAAWQGKLALRRAGLNKLERLELEAWIFVEI